MNNIFKPKQIHSVTKHPLPFPLEPTCVSQAMKDPKCRKAMFAKFDALVLHGTWELVSASLSRKPIPLKWVFQIKRHPDSIVDRFKARLVAKGFHQRPSLDCTETFSPVLNPPLST